MNLTTLTALAAQLAQDPDQSRYSGKYTQALNLAQQEFSIDSKCTFKYVTNTIISGTATYSLPSDFLFEVFLTIANSPLQPIDRRELARVTANGQRWDTVKGSPTHYMIDPDESHKVITLYPIPQSNDAASPDNDLTMKYVGLPTDLSSGSDIPLNSSALLLQFHKSLAAWAAWYLMQSEQDTEATILKKKELLEMYNSGVTQAVDTFKNTVSQPIRMRVNRTYF